MGVVKAKVESCNYWFSFHFKLLLISFYGVEMLGANFTEMFGTNFTEQCRSSRRGMGRLCPPNKFLPSGVFFSTSSLQYNFPQSKASVIIFRQFKA